MNELVFAETVRAGVSDPSTKERFSAYRDRLDTTRQHELYRMYMMNRVLANVLQNILQYDIFGIRLYCPTLFFDLKCRFSYAGGV